jgi:SAM-dependent methyltransferase
MNLRQRLKRLIPTAWLHRYGRWKYRHKRLVLEGIPAEAVFTRIYQTRHWGGAAQPASGPGSTLEATAAIRAALPELLQKYEIKSILDIPCGDFSWMQHVDLQGIDYTGGDIVMPLIAELQARYEQENRRFRVLDLCTDPLPKVDLVIVRDCWVHLSNEAIGRAIANIRSSGSRYLLVTTFRRQTRNQDILTGEWRPVSLEHAPWHWPAPLQVLDEQSTEADGRYRDKCLGLWAVADVS